MKPRRRLRNRRNAKLNLILGEQRQRTFHSAIAVPRMKRDSFTEALPQRAACCFAAGQDSAVWPGPSSQDMNIKQLQRQSSGNLPKEEYRRQIGPDSIDRQIKMDITDNARTPTFLP